MTTPASEPHRQHYNCYNVITNEWQTLEEIIIKHGGSYRGDTVRYRNALNAYFDAGLIERELSHSGCGCKQRYRKINTSAPAPAQERIDAVIRELKPKIYRDQYTGNLAISWEDIERAIALLQAGERK